MTYILDLMSRNVVLKTISLTQIGREKFYWTAIILSILYLVETLQEKDLPNRPYWLRGCF